MPLAKDEHESRGPWPMVNPDLQIRGGGLPAPSPGSAIVDKGELAFSTITYLFGKSHVSNSLWSFISERPTKAFHWWKAEKPPIFQGDVSRTLRMFNILKSIQPVYPFSPTQTFWGVRYARVPTYVSLFLLLIVAPKPVSIKSIRRKPAEKIKKQHRSFMPFIFPIK